MPPERFGSMSQSFMINDVSNKAVLLLMYMFSTCRNNFYNKDFCLCVIVISIMD